MASRPDIPKIVNELLLTKGVFASGEVAAAAGLSRQAVHRHLRRAVASGQLITQGKARATLYRARRAAFHARFPREGLSEDVVWAQVPSALPALARPAHAPAAAVLAYAFTEMLNNAIDHSAAAQVDVTVELDEAANRVRFTVADDGVGVFGNVRDKLRLDSALVALQELSKGKVSTDPARHSGEGIFFTSKMGDLFDLTANGLTWSVDNLRGDHAIAAAPARAGTEVRFEVSLGTRTTPEEVFGRYTHDFEFDTSRAVVKLFEHGVRFVSRSEAKRLLAGLERFREVILDFAGVQGVGQGFADEVFRVWAGGHPDVRLRSEQMVPPVAFMVERARRAARSA